MKTSTLIAAIATVFAAAGASAQEATYELPQPVTSQTTRAAVMAELLQARANGTLQVTEYDRNVATPSVSLRSRAEVQAEARAAVASGESIARHSEHAGFDIGVATNGARSASQLMAAAR
jgi:hypothetical protein